MSTVVAPAVLSPRPVAAPVQTSSGALSAGMASAYGLPRPTMESAREAFLGVFGGDPRAQVLWGELVASARPGSGDLAGLWRLTDAMQASADGVVALCGSGLAIRLRTFEELTEVRVTVDTHRAR